MELSSSFNLVDLVIDEIALEGLDGITLEALWDRLAMRFKEKESISLKLMEQIWNICLQVRELSFYRLAVPRDKLIIFNRYDFVDPELGIILEPEVTPDDIYPHCPIEDTKNGIKGSCSTYQTREEIGSSIRTLTVHEAQEIYGRSLVIVASQEVRQTALMDKNVCPTLELTVTPYCFLERVGRARYHGEVTQGKLSLSALQEDPRSLFYHRKFLLRYKLVTKQMHHQKSGGHSCTGSLLHLPRFFVERKPKIIYLAQKVIEVLKSRENQVAEYSEIKKELGITNSIKKLFKTACFQNVVKTDMVVPYRMLYPLASKREWQCKNTPSKEKMLRVVQLIDTNIDVSNLWTKEEVLDDDEPFELEISEQKYCVPFMKQANLFVEASGQEGLGQSELARRMGLPKLQSRTIFRNLVKSRIVAVYMNDMGRQRVTKYVSRKFEDASRLSKQFKHEACKMRKLALAPKLQSIEENKAMEDEKMEVPPDTPIPEKIAQPIDDTIAKSTESDTNEEEIAKETPEKCEKRETRSLEVATKILHRYKMQACGTKYKRTFRNIAGMKDEVMEAVRRNKRPRLSEETVAKDVEVADTDNEKEPKSEDSLPIAMSMSLQQQAVSGLMDDLHNLDFQNQSNITYRLLKRANIIIESVKEHKVIDDTTKLMKLITEEEEKEGYDVKIDKKSLIRLLRRLAKDELVKNIKLTLSTGEKQKSLTFICDPSIDVNHTVIRSAVEQAKLKFCLMGTQKVETVLQSNNEKVELCENSDELNSTEKLNFIDNESKKVLPTDLVFDRKAGKRYGYSPKFIRMQTLHAFLFYLVYEHPGEPTDSQEKLVETLRAKGLAIDENVEKEMSALYTSEVGWKMFVPPLPLHNGWPLGWTLICDILLRIPLSIFLKVHKVAYNIPDLDAYRNHPIRKHLLVKDLPAPIRNVLLNRRKYIFSVHDVISRLCYIGLVQFGSQKLKEKDKVFVYLNRKTELLDTTTSAAHYHLIEEKEYSVTTFYFTSLNAVEKYWYKLWSTCVNTRLGGRLVVEGKDIVLEDLDKKFEMIEATKAQAPEDAAERDNGHVPGDRRGAAGVDSAFFAHLKRNWNWDSSNYPFKNVNRRVSQSSVILDGERDAHMSRVKPKPLKFTDYHGLRKISGPVTMDAVDLKKSQSSVTKNVSAVGKKAKKTSTWPASCKGNASNRQRSYVRRVLPRRRHIRPRVKYDEIDYSALQRMDKLRVDWDTREDNILLVCKVAMMYLCPNARKQIITFAAVRDVLRSYSLTSLNKTSRACQRRLLYILKQPHTSHSVTLGVEELKQNYFVTRRFADTLEKIKKQCRNVLQCDQQLNVAFRDLVAYIAKKNYDICDIQSAPMSFATSTVEEFGLFHRIKYPVKPTGVQGFHDDTTNDIHAATINSVIHSSMCCGKDRRSWAYQLFRIYQQYPEWLLRSAMAKIRTDQMISVKKHYAFAMRKQTNACMPMSSSQYQLSSGYVQKFNTKLPYSIFKESYEFFLKLIEHYNERFFKRTNTDRFDCSGIEAVPNGGIIAAIHDHINIGKLEFDIEIPQHIIMLDPELSRDDESYIRIARRFHDILRNIEHIHMDEIFEDFDEPETLPETKAVEEAALDDLKAPEKMEIETKDEKVEEPPEKTCEQKTEEKPKTPELKITPVVTKSQEPDTHINYDTEAFESDHEVNFEEDDDDEEDIDETEDEEDDLICFLDGTKIRLTSEDIEKSGLRINAEESLLHEKFDKPTRDNFATLNKRVECVSRDTEINSNAEKSSELMNEPELREKKNLEQEEEMEPSEPAQILVEGEIAAGEKRDRPVRVNEMIESVKKLQNTKRPNHRAAEGNDADRKCTRIALLKMREELNDLTPNDSHHAHEHFVLNMFKIFYSLPAGTRVNDSTDLSASPDIDVLTEFMSLKNDDYDELINDIKTFATFPKTCVPYKRWKREIKATEVFQRGLDAVYEFVREKREIGASLDQLAAQFYKILGDSLYETLFVLREARLVLRSGVKTTRYVHQKFADPWLIHSYKIMRLQKEGLPNVPSGSLYVTAGEKHKDPAESSTGNQEEETDENGGKKNRAACPTESENASSSQRKMQKSRTCLLQTKDVYRAAKQLDLDTAEEIRVLVRPWIRVDGALNRRVLDRMLGGVLAYCLIHPGLYLTKVQEKFAPAIQPFHTKELVEMLVKLKCLQIGSARKTIVTLVSKSSSAKPTFTDIKDRIEHSEEELLIEPVLGATLKFAVFLSKRTYTSDFLSL